MLTGGLIHLVHQLAVVREEPDVQGGGATIAVLITGVLTRDPGALEALQAAGSAWFSLLRQADPEGFAGLRMVRAKASSRPGSGIWPASTTSGSWASDRLWSASESAGSWWREMASGIYYRCAREVRAVVPSLLNRPIPEPGRAVSYVLSGRQPCWHRPPVPAAPAPLERRQQLFASLTASQESAASRAAGFCREVSDPGRPLWLCSVPNLAHQFPGQRIPLQVLRAWRVQLEREHGFDGRRDRLVLIDHPKAPPRGSFGGEGRELSWLGGPLRTPIPLEVLVAELEREQPDRPVMVAGLTSALYGVRHLTRAQVVWLGLAPLWRANPLYRGRPLEFLHRFLRVRRMALLTAQVDAAGPAGGHRRQ